MIPADSHDEKRFKVADASSYDDVTEAFERYTERFTKPLAHRLVELASARGADRVLDVGAGTGVVSFAAREQLTGEGSVVAVDLSERMLDVARAKEATQLPGPRMVFRQADAEHLDLPGESFDVVLSLFTLMHLPNPGLAIGEMFRVLERGGRLAVAFGSGPKLLTGNGVANAFEVLGHRIAELTGRCLSAPSFLHDLLDKHVSSGTNPEEAEIARTRQGARASALMRMTTEAGFMHVRSTWAGGVGVLATAEEFWELQVTYSSRARKRLAAADPAEVDALRDRFFETSRAVLRRGGRLIYPYGMRVITARRPS